MKAATHFTFLYKPSVPNVSKIPIEEVFPIVLDLSALALKLDQIGFDLH